MYSVKIVSQAVTSSTIPVSIKRRCPSHSPLEGNAQNVTCIIFLKCSCLMVVAVLAVVPIAEAAVVVVVVVVNIVFYCRRYSLCNYCCFTLGARDFSTLRRVY